MELDPPVLEHHPDCTRGREASNQSGGCQPEEDGPLCAQLTRRQEEGEAAHDHDKKAEHGRAALDEHLAGHHDADVGREQGATCGQQGCLPELERVHDVGEHHAHQEDCEDRPASQRGEENERR